MEGRSVEVRRHKPSFLLTLHDVIVPAVGELSILPTHIQATQVDLVWLAVLELNELPQAREELGVAVGAVLIGQDGNLVVALGHRDVSQCHTQCQQHCTSTRDPLLGLDDCPHSFKGYDF